MAFQKNFSREILKIFKMASYFPDVDYLMRTVLSEKYYRHSEHLNEAGEFVRFSCILPYFFIPLFHTVGTIY